MENWKQQFKTSWALPPTEEEAALWDSLTRDQQLEIMRELVTHPDANTPTDATVDDILKEARARKKKKQL